MSDVSLTIDGLAVTVPAGTTVFDAARVNGILIPTLCHQQNETPAGVCRVCVVEARGRVLTASCIRPAENKMVVTTNSPKVAGGRKNIVELPMADHPSPSVRVLPSGFRRAVRTTPRPPFLSTTKRAFCATAASGAASRSNITTFWDG